LATLDVHERFVLQAALAPLRERDALSVEFIDRFADFCAAAAPRMSFLTEAVGLKW